MMGGGGVTDIQVQLARQEQMISRLASELDARSRQAPVAMPVAPMTASYDRGYSGYDFVFCCAFTIRRSSGVGGTAGLHGYGSVGSGYQGGGGGYPGGVQQSAYPGSTPSYGSGGQQQR